MLSAVLGVCCVGLCSVLAGEGSSWVGREGPCSVGGSIVSPFPTSCLGGAGGVSRRSFTDKDSIPKSASNFL